MSAYKSPSPPFALTSIVVSMGLLAIGNGLMFAYIPVKLVADGFEPWVAGAIVTSMAVGGFVGCLMTGKLVQRVGHARVFATFTATVIVSILAVGLGTFPYLWIVARALYGLAATGLFIVTQSWLNHACDNAWRGKVIGIFYMIYVVAIGIGSYLLKFVELDGSQAPMIAIFFAAAAILPVSLTRLSTPPPPESVSVAIRAVWKISPVGLAGLLAVGGLTMMVQGFGPIYVAAEGYTKDEVALLLFLMQFGMVFVQYPLGALSDRIDRRIVLLIAAVIVIAMAAITTQMSGVDLMWLIVIFAIWGGATESIFSVANAHANDRADPQYYVSLSSTLLVAWSISGFVVPALTTALTPVFGPRAFIYVVIAIGALYGLFVVYRFTRRDATREEDQEPYQQISAQAPYTPELSPLAVDEPADTDNDPESVRP